MDEINSPPAIEPWLVLLHTPGLSATRLVSLVLDFGNPERIIAADAKVLRAAGLADQSIRFLQNPDREKINADLSWLKKPGNHLISILHEDFPSLLKNIPDPPAALFVSGNVKVLGKPQIAIVGTRKPTAGGRRTANEFSEQLSACGITVTSGLALGIDTAVHIAAVNSGKPTIAVLGNGLNTIYPAVNRELSDKIRINGALVSEFTVDTRPIPANFPRRNRIISGLALGTLVVEAASRSGSLITARLAAEQGREVFSIPGSIHNPMAVGCHTLISDGAKLTANIHDILEEIEHLQQVSLNCDMDLKSEPVANETLDEASKLLLDNIGYEPVSIDQLVYETGLPVKKVSILLMELELSGHIDTHPGGRFSKK